MYDKFERSIKEAAENFHKPFREKEVAWKGIEQKLHQHKRRRLGVRLSIAASLLILIGAGTVFLMNSNNSESKRAASYYYKISEDLSETEFYYSMLIENKQQQVKKDMPFDKDLFKPFFIELSELDHQYKAYKSELNSYGYHEELIRALIVNQQQKLHVLNRLLTEIQKVKSYENRKKEYRF